jgi:hypothetical protein
MFGVVYRYDGELVHMVAHYNFTAEGLALLNKVFPSRPDAATTATLRAILERDVVHVEDASDDPRHPAGAGDQGAMPFRNPSS